MSSRPLPESLQVNLAGLSPAERAEKVELYQELATADEECRRLAADLAALNQMEDLIRVRVRQAAHRCHASVYIVGRPGTGKTEVVLDELASLGPGVKWAYRKGWVNPVALFHLLRRHPDHLIVLDDVSELFRNPQSKQLLMAALGGDPGRPRAVTYSARDREQTVEFRGAVVALSNLALQADPLAQAVVSRTVVVSHEPTDELLAAKMRRLADGGYDGLTPAEAREVTEFVLAECLACDYPADLRGLMDGVRDYRFCRTVASPHPWQELVRSNLRKLARGATLARPTSEADRMAEEQRIARELYDRYPAPTGAKKAERDEEWRRRTGASPDSYYRRLRGLGYRLGRPPRPQIEAVTADPVAPPPAPAIPGDDPVEQAALTLGLTVATLRDVLARSGHLPSAPP